MKNSAKRKPLPLLPALLLACFLSGCGIGATEPEAEPIIEEAPPVETVPGEIPTAEEIIEEIVLFHGFYDAAADGKVDGLLAELERLDKRQGELWRSIMDYWKYANTELTVNLETLPEDLPPGDNLCIIVLGFELNDDGTMKDELIGRLTVALTCAEQYPSAYVVCTGGGTARNHPDVTEAGLMGDWLLAHGLEEKRLIIEDQSMSTAENAQYSYAILLADYPQVDSAVIVSSSYHIAWGSLLFESAFLKSASENRTPELHVISNCAYPVASEIYKESEILRWETGGMLEMIGEPELAMQFYMNYGHLKRPEL